MRGLIKMIVCTALLTISYIGISLLLSKNQKFEIYFFLKNDNMLIAKENNIFIKEIESLVIDDKRWIIYQSNFCFYKSYGFLELFKHKECPDKLSWVKIELLDKKDLDNKSNYYVSYNRYKKKTLFNDYNGCISKEGDTLKIEIFDDKEILLKSLLIPVK